MKPADQRIISPRMRSRTLSTIDRRRVLAGALRRASYEVLPFASTEEKVLAHVPRDVAITVTTTEAKGLGPTVDLATRLSGHGYRVAPHLAARQVRDHVHLDDIVARLRERGVDGVFVIGGDAVNSGAFPDALSLLRALDERGHRFSEVGIGGYPEGHGNIPDDAIAGALLDKAPSATHVTTQLCFDPGTTVAWARQVWAQGLRLPIRVGIPGAVSRQKLIRVSAGLGLGQSARFLMKQQSMFWRFFAPAGYSPNRLLESLTPTFLHDENSLEGFHVFTFNDLQSTETWRREWLARLS